MQKRQNFSAFTFMMVIVAGLVFQPAASTYALCPDDMAGYWKLDETTPGTYADFIRGNDGTGSPADPTPATGTVSGAQEFNFNDIDTGIDVDASSAFNWLGTDSFSIELWVQTDGVAPAAAPAGNEVLIGRKEDATSMQWWIGLQGGTGNVTFYLRDVGGTNVINQAVVGTSLTADTDWHHVVLVRDASTGVNTNTLYVDGQVQGTPVTQAFAGGFGSADAPLTLGYLAGNVPGFYFDGLLDEVALYDRVLDSIEIGEHYNTGLNGDDVCGGVDTPGAPYPVATISLWPLDEPGGSTYFDVVDSNDGTGNPADPTAAAGTVSGAQEFNFNDIDTGIDVDASSAFNWLGTDSFSIELWVQTDGVAPAAAPAGNEVLIGRKEDATSMQWWIGLQGGTGNATFYLRDVGGTNVINQAVVGTSLTADTDWHHVVLVRDASTGVNTNTLYVDGQVQGTPVTQAFAGGFGSAGAPLTLGYLAGNVPGFYFDGLLDEVALYDRVLDSIEIGEHYTAGLNGNGVGTLRPEPVADAGADQSVTEGTTVTLNGSGSSDADGTIASYEWQQETGTLVTLTTLITPPFSASFTAPTVDAAGEILTFRLTVTDNDGLSSTDMISVQVNDTTTTTPPPAGGGGDGGGGCFITTMF